MIVTSNPLAWQGMFDCPLGGRMGAAPFELIDYIALVNTVSGHPHSPGPAEVDDDFLADVRNAIEDMPAAVQQLIERELLGVFFAQGLGSSAVTDALADCNGTVLGYVVVIDVAAFAHRTANQWATWKENTPFAQAQAVSVETLIAEPQEDSRKNALQFLLLHEFGHVLTPGTATIPNWWCDPQTIEDTEAYPFLALDWEITRDKKIVPRKENDFPLRKDVSYYTDTPMDGSALLGLYDALQHTSFATLYAATNVYDDFAESFATYVHTVLLKRRYETRVWRDGVVVLNPEPFWSSRRCSAKYQFMQRYLGSENALAPASKTPASH